MMRATALMTLLVALLAAGLAAQEPEAESPPKLAIEEIVVEPAKPAAETLCRLSVRISNQGEEIASQLGFQVKLNGQELAVYGNQLFMFPLDPGATSEVKLYNFWTTETSRSMPADGKLTVEVALTEARWMSIENDDEGVEVWTPLGDVTGLPVSNSVTLEMETGG